MDLTEDLYSKAKEPLCKVAKWDDEYRKAKPKVLFILKEPSTRNNDPDYNFQRGLQDEKWKKLGMWRLLAYCSEGLQAIARGAEPRFRQKDYPDIGECKKLLRLSSYMNLKRFGAGTSSDMSLVGLHAGLFWPLMLAEIIKVKPQIIVCCATHSILKELLACLNKLPAYTKALGYPACGTIERDADNGRCVFWNWESMGRKIAVINMAHPARKNHKEYFDELMELASKVWCQIES